MPEGPEVYVMTQKFKKRFPPGHSLTCIKVMHERYNDIPRAFLNSFPLKIIDIKSRGKKTIVQFKNWCLLVSYGMTGHWEVKNNKFAQLKFTFKSLKGFANSYYWTSSRSLPTCIVEFLTNAQLAKLDLGLDIIHDNPSPEEVLNVYGYSKRNVCAFLMDQQKFSGIGNYIKAVILYRCKVSPHRKVNELDDGEKWLLWETAKQVAREAIAAKGMGIRDYKDEHGLVVGVSFDITPYNKIEDKFGNKVISEIIAGRQTWWVPEVQQ